jgi:hypothetical protein
VKQSIQTSSRCRLPAVSDSAKQTDSVQSDSQKTLFHAAPSNQAAHDLALLLLSLPLCPYLLFGISPQSTSLQMEKPKTIWPKPNNIHRDNPLQFQFPSGTRREKWSTRWREGAFHVRSRSRGPPLLTAFIVFFQHRLVTQDRKPAVLRADHG